MVSAMNLGLKHSLLVFTGSEGSHVVLTEILETDVKLNIIVYFKET